MGYAERHEVTLTTDSGGDVTAYTPVLSGYISAVIYTKTDFDNGVDFTVTKERGAPGSVSFPYTFPIVFGDDSQEPVWEESDVNASQTVAPRQPVFDTAGAASLYAAAGEPVESRIGLANERIKLVVAQGGDTKTGKITVLVE